MFDRFVTRLPKLNGLILYASDTTITEADIKALAESESLTGISIHEEDGLNDRSLELLSKMRKLSGLHVQGSGITDKGIAHLHHLKVLSVPSTSVSDEGCKLLASFPVLENLDLRITPITDAGLQHLATSKTIKILQLGECKQITDRGMESVAQIGTLTYLNIYANPQLTDKALEPLAKLTGLTDLAIFENPKLTEAAVRKLQAALPKCKIVSDFGTREPTRD